MRTLGGAFRAAREIQKIATALRDLDRGERKTEWTRGIRTTHQRETNHDLPPPQSMMIGGKCTTAKGRARGRITGTHGPWKRKHRARSVQEPLLPYTICLNDRWVGGPRGKWYIILLYIRRRRDSSSCCCCSLLLLSTGLVVRLPVVVFMFTEIVSRNVYYRYSATVWPTISSESKFKGSRSLRWC